ncbi:MAG TPA: aminotransferase class V-fold PLP-dependent enzyme [Acidimicrobiia bacterium]|nr:aminotransferase class V-fold PLP-dependent enzyme [Acidimicrobiia bacterium]
MNLKPHFSRFLEAGPGRAGVWATPPRFDRLHFAAHSHHPWPDVSFEAQQQAWLDAAAMMDDKWDHVFGEVIPSARSRVARVLGLADASTLTFGPNTHSFLMRIFSCLDPPVRVLATDSEFHSFTRQSRRWEEAGLAIVDRISAEPFDSFPERLTREARAGAHDLIYLSQVLFDSGLLLDGMDQIVSSVPENRTFVVIDGYHAFMALPVNLGAIQDRVFFMAGGYKYAMSGEGACFLHSPAGYCPRPVDTGWYAGFGQLESGVGEKVAYGSDGSRFSGATFDPTGVYRMDAVLRWLESEGVSPIEIHHHALGLQERFLAGVPDLGKLLIAEPGRRGNFLTFRSSASADRYLALHQRGVITDYRGDRIRIGFGIYHDESDVDRLLEHVHEIGTSRHQIRH